ncbi:MAG: alpha/beta fold hydrolase [Pararhodobacter sp.]|nr:alpha/beta fold hydrolase [Pararhodobacter sp.]
MLLSLYERALGDLPVQASRMEIATRFGPTNVLMLGPEEAPPVVVHQGGNFPNPVTLGWFVPLARQWRILAPDLPGAPGYSAPVHLDGRKGQFHAWALDVLDALGLDRVPHLGASFGAGVILETTAQAPDRIERMGLVAPAGVIKPAIWPLLTRLALPMIRYRLRPTRANLVAAVGPLHTDPPSDLVLDIHAAVFHHLRLAHRMPGPVGSKALAAFDGPALIVAAENDPLFPAATLLERARLLLPRAQGMVLAGSRHFPSAKDQVRIGNALFDFMQATPAIETPKREINS